MLESSDTCSHRKKGFHEPKPYRPPLAHLLLPGNLSRPGWANYGPNSVSFLVFLLPPPPPANDVCLHFLIKNYKGSFHDTGKLYEFLFQCSEIKSFIETQLHSCVYCLQLLLCCSHRIEYCSCHLWLAKPKLVTIWPFTTKVCPKPLGAREAPKRNLKLSCCCHFLLAKFLRSVFYLPTTC